MPDAVRPLRTRASRGRPPRSMRRGHTTAGRSRCKRIDCRPQSGPFCALPPRPTSRISQLGRKPKAYSSRGVCQRDGASTGKSTSCAKPAVRPKARPMARWCSTGQGVHGVSTARTSSTAFDTTTERTPRGCPAFHPACWRTRYSGRPWAICGPSPSRKGLRCRGSSRPPRWPRPWPGPAAEPRGQSIPGSRCFAARPRAFWIGRWRLANCTTIRSGRYTDRN